MDEQELEETQKQAAIAVAEAESALQAVLPSRGQGVHYVTSDYSHVGGTPEGVHLPAGVEVAYSGGLCDLKLIDRTGDVPAFWTVSGCEHDESKAPGTWHFIEA